MWIFNITAVICVVVGIVGAIGTFQWTGNREYAVIGATVTAMLVDVWYRFRSEDSNAPLIDPEAGGHVWFVPVWGVGIILIILVALSHYHII